MAQFALVAKLSTRWRHLHYANVCTLCKCSLSVLFSVLRVCSESVGAWKPAYSCLYYIHGLSEKSQQVAFVDLK